VDNSWFDRQTSAFSAATSALFYADPGQTLLFLDWDDTLFPTSDIFREERSGRLDPFEDYEESDAEEDERVEALERWRASLKRFLETACAVSDRCVIVTNSARPWVTNSVGIFAPELLPLFGRPDGKGLHVVYAVEAMREQRWSWCLRGARSCHAGVEAWIRKGLRITQARPSSFEELTLSKQFAMRREAQNFYARYPGQTWKNIISFGDMCFEHDALWQVTSSRLQASPRDRLRTKAITLPEASKVGTLANHLAVAATLLPAYVAFDGDIDLDLRRAPIPLQEVGKALQMPRLADLSFNPYGYGCEEHGISEKVLDELHCIVQERFALGA